jgi:hypothetical protein
VVHVAVLHIANGFVAPLGVVVLHEASNGAFQLPSIVVIFKALHVPYRAVAALDPALGYWAISPPPRVGAPVLLEVGGQVFGDLTRAVVVERLPPVLDAGLIPTMCRARGR